MGLFSRKKTKIPKLVIGINQVDNLGPWDEKLNLPTEETERLIEKRANAIIEQLSKGSHSAAKEQIEYYSALRAYKLNAMIAKIAQNCKAGVIIPDNPVMPWDKQFDMPDEVRNFYVEKSKIMEEKFKEAGIEAILAKILNDGNLTEKEKKELVEKWNEKKNTPIKVGILGKTGVGKTTTINNLFQAKFKTSRNAVGTTAAQYKDFTLPNNGGTITIIDMPGYGRSMDEDEEYKKIYLQELPQCDIIILIVQADSRDLEDDQIMIETLYEWSKEGRI